MNTSERLRALTIPLLTDDDDQWELAMSDFAEVMAQTFPQIVAVVEAAEKAERYDYCDPDDGDGICSDPDGRWAEWQDIGAALAALDEALQ